MSSDLPSLLSLHRQDFTGSWKTTPKPAELAAYADVAQILLKMAISSESTTSDHPSYKTFIR
jgi:hypothetical protein